MKLLGNAVAGNVYGDTRVDLPRANGVRRSHRPWCVDCKRILDVDQLDDDGRCERCARAAVIRAEAAVRRAETQRRAAAEASAARRAEIRAESPRLPTEGKQGRPAPRSSAPRRRSASRTTRRARVAGPSTHREKNPRAARETRPAAARGPRHEPKAPQWRAVEELAVVTDYLTHGMTAPQIAEKYGVTPKRIRAILDRRGVDRRDDRAGHSGSTPKEYDPETVAQVAELYERGLSQVEVADQLGLTRKIVWRIMVRHDIKARQRVNGRQDGARGLKDLMAALDIDSATVKRWALERGLLNDATKPGLPSLWLVEAYAEEHE